MIWGLEALDVFFWGGGGGGAVFGGEDRGGVFLRGVGSYGERGERDSRRSEVTKKIN